MRGSDLSNHRNWLENLAESTPDMIVLSNREQARMALDVALLQSTSKQIAAPAFSSHLIAIHLEGIPNFIGKIDRQIYEAEVKKGEASIIPAGLESEWQWQKQGRCNTLHLALDAAFVRQVAVEDGYVNAEGIEILNQFIVQDPQVQHIGLALKAEMESHNLMGRLYSESLATALAVRLLRQYSTLGSTLGQQLRDPEGGISRQKFHLIGDYINDRLNADLTLVDIAALVNLSPSHFTRLFKQSVGITPYQYVIQCRVERARLLLRRGDLTIGEVATLVGFHDQSHFTYHFKRIMGVTPKRFLQEQQ